MNTRAPGFKPLVADGPHAPGPLPLPHRAEPTCGLRAQTLLGNFRQCPKAQAHSQTYKKGGGAGTKCSHRAGATAATRSGRHCCSSPGTLAGTRVF